MEKEKINAFLFDLDGTLVDSLQDIAEAMNRVLEHRGYAPHPLHSYRTFVGDGLEMLVRRVLPVEKVSHRQISELILEMKEAYAQRWDHHSVPYPGIPEVLRSCAERGLRLGVLSNKPEEFTLRMVQRFFPDIPFSPIRGAREGVPVKPDPTSAHAIREEWGVEAGRIGYVGDTNTDIRTGLSAGFRTFGVSWGFRERHELEEAGAHQVVDSPVELLRFLD